MKKRVLVLSCGTIDATDINMSLRDNNEFELWGASTQKNHGIYVYKNYIDDIPNIYHEDFIDVLNKKIEEYDFKFIIATHEDMALKLQEEKSKINAIIVCSEYETALLCRYKSKTYEKMKNYDFIPRTYTKEEVSKYPVFVKKDNDQGARHAYIVSNKKQLDLYTQEDDMIICEYLPGEEITVDCFSNKKHELLFCNPRAADRILAGIDVHARRVELDSEIKNIAESLNKEIKFRGFWFFQIKKDVNGKFKLLEISTRLAGSFSLSRCMDVNLPLLALKDFDEQNVTISYNDLNIEADKQFFGKYSMNLEYDNIYLDFDTVFEKKDINTFLMMYLYQCVNKKINIYIYGTDKYKILNFLEDKKIEVNLFEDIIQTKDIANEIITESIVISNNDIVKQTLRKEKGIYGFASSIVEALIDWKG